MKVSIFKEDQKLWRKLQELSEKYQDSCQFLISLINVYVLGSSLYFILVRYKLERYKEIGISTSYISWKGHHISITTV